MDKVVFVGDKPSNKNVHKDVPFVGTKSYKRLLSWIYELDIDISNVRTINQITINPEYPHSYFHIVNGRIQSKVIALGLEAEKKLKKCGIEYFPMPHPSYSNIKFNGVKGKKFEKEVIEQCKKWLKS